MNDLVVSPHPLVLDEQRITRGAQLIPGETLAAFLQRHGVDLSRGDWVVTIGGALVPRLMWDHTRPRHGHLIECRRTAGKKVLTIVAIAFVAWVTMGAGLAVMGFGAQAGLSAAAIAGSGVTGLAGALGMSAGFAALAVNVGAYMLGSMLVQKLLPPAKMKSPAYDATTTSQTYSVSGGRNQKRPYEPLGLIFGVDVRVVPDFAADPYQWFAGDDQYQYVRLHGGLNLQTVADLRIGDTSISTYQDVEVSRSGFPGEDSDLTDWSNVDTIAGGTLDAPGPGAGEWQVRTSSANAVKLAIDIGGSVYRMGDDGGMQAAMVTIEAEYRKLPDGDWLPFSSYSDSQLVISSSATKPVRLTYVTPDLVAAQYEVRCRKVTVNASSTREQNSIEWGSLKSYQVDDGAYKKHPHVGIKIKASGQISGALDSVNWLGTSAAVPVWTSGGWVTQVTRNPGAHILRFARGIFDEDGRLQAGMGLPDEQIDVEQLKLFMLHCAEKGYTFDYWFDQANSCGEILDAMAACGLGAIGFPNGKLSVIWLRDDQPLRSVVNMANIKRGSFRVDYATRELAEELEISFPDRNAGWVQRSLRVKAPGVSMPRDTARLAPVGVSDEAGALVQARFVMAQNIYQRKSVTWEMDLEHLTFQRFSLIALSHDLTRWGAGGRLVAANEVGGVVSLLLDEPVKPAIGVTSWYVGLRLPRDAGYRVFRTQPVTEETRTLVLDEPWPAGVALPGGEGNPAHDVLWIFDFKATPGQRLRVTGIEPANGLKGARITAVPEGDEFWNYVATGEYVASPLPPARDPLVVSNVRVTQDRLDVSYDQQAQLTVTFDVRGAYDHAEIWAAPLGQTKQYIGQTYLTRYEGWVVATTGQLAVEVRPFDALGRQGAVGDFLMNVTISDVPAGAVKIQYSADGVGWHDAYEPSDIYMRQRVGAGDWSAAIRIVGEAGEKGDPGAPGEAGPAGPKYGQAALYQWSAVEPAAPQGASVYTWASGAVTEYSGGNGWQAAMPANPGTPGVRLWQASRSVSAAGTAATTTFNWVGAAVQALAANGESGLMAAKAAVFKWAASLPASPSGSSDYTWASGAIDPAPAGWAIAPAASPSAGMTLYEASVQVTDVSGSTHTSVDWVQASIKAVGYAGQNGAPGGAGAVGASYRVAYAVITGASLASSPETVSTAGAGSFPTDNTWGGGEHWQATVPAFGANQSVMRIDGIYSTVTGQTVWTAPYLATWKVGSLSAITANLGHVTAGSISINGKFEVSSDGYFVARGGQLLDEAGNVVISTKAGASAALPSSWVAASAGWLTSHLGVTAAGQLYGVGAGSGTTVSNQQIQVQGGVLTGIGTTSVVVDNAAISTGGNLCPNGDFAANLAGWLVETNYFGAQIAVNGITGSEWWLGRGATEGTLVVQQNNSDSGGYFEIRSDRIPLSPSTRYAVTALTGAHRCKGDVFMWVYAADGTLLGQIGADEDYNDEAMGGGSVSSAYKQHCRFGVTHASAAYGKVAIRKFGTKPGQSDSYLFVGRVMVCRAGATATAAPNWSPAGAAALTYSRIGEVAGLQLVPSYGVEVSGRTVTKRFGNSAWDAGAYSRDSFTGGAYVSWSAEQTNKDFMVGLNTWSDLTDSGYGSIDFAMFCDANGNLSAWTSGNYRGNIGSYSTGDVLSISYDGTTVRWMRGGAVLWSTGAVVTQALFADMSFLSIGASLRGLQFGPMTSNQWSDIGGAGKPQDNATVGATVGVNLGGSFSQASFDVIMNGQALIRAAHVQELTTANLTVTTLSQVLNNSTNSGARIALETNTISMYRANNSLSMRLRA